MVINDKITVFYNTTDGENLLPGALKVADIYFKRSYRKDAVPEPYLGMVLPPARIYDMENSRRFNGVSGKIHTLTINVDIKCLWIVNLVFSSFLRIDNMRHSLTS